MELVRRINPSDLRPAALVLSARAWEYKDRGKAIGLLNRAVEAESRRRSYDDGELDYAFDLLSKVAVGRADFAEAARLRRLQASRIGLTRDSYPAPVFELFVLHGKYGPLEGLEQDIQAHQQYLGYPQVLYALSRAYERAGRLIESQACADAARVSAFEPPEPHSTSERTLVISFLKTAGWIDLARREAYAVLGNDSPDAVSDRRNARLQLAQLAADQQDHAQAIEHYTALRDLLDKRDAESVMTGQRYLDSQLAWRKAHLAHARGDSTDANRQIDALVKLAPLDHQVLLDAYPVVTALGRLEDAARLFEPVYNESRERLESDPENPTWMNELAWTCARCDQKLDDALKLAEKAVSLEPDNAAFIDTLAEVTFRLGRAEEAAKLEARALELEPGDAFMSKQLERFKAAHPK
jgi:tetratricopeptide (TPR) repeat protein